MKNLKGCFITLEGGEGSGKSTLLLKLRDFLIAKQYKVICTREPGGTKLGEKIREMLLSRETDFQVAPLAEVMLFLAARAEQIEEVIKPALEKEKIVICDRYNDSTIAYQAARGLDKKILQHYCELVCGAIVPHLTLFLDVNPKTGLQRSCEEEKENSAKGELDRIENQALNFHETVRKNFLWLAQQEPLRIHRIDANQSLESVLKEALTAVEVFLSSPSAKKL